jgi:hypothetical protein
MRIVHKHVHIYVCIYTLLVIQHTWIPGTRNTHTVTATLANVCQHINVGKTDATFLIRLTIHSLQQFPLSAFSVPSCWMIELKVESEDHISPAKHNSIVSPLCHLYCQPDTLWAGGITPHEQAATCSSLTGVERSGTKALSTPQHLVNVLSLDSPVKTPAITALWRAENDLSDVHVIFKGRKERRCNVLQSSLTLSILKRLSTLFLSLHALHVAGHHGQMTGN